MGRRGSVGVALLAVADLGGAYAQISGLLGRREHIMLTAEELAARFPPDALRPELVQRAALLGLIEATDDGPPRVPDARFVETGDARPSPTPPGRRPR